MKGMLCVFCLLLFGGTIHSDVRGQNIFDIFFGEPRKGRFKILKHDEFDISDATHIAGSGVASVGFYTLF
ncbi:MAG: hypothetical protein ACE5JB_09315 [bacterium]